MKYHKINPTNQGIVNLPVKSTHKIPSLPHRSHVNPLKTVVNHMSFNNTVIIVRKLKMMDDADDEEWKY